MTSEPARSSPSFGLSATSRPKPDAPPWLTEALLLLRSFCSSWMLLVMAETLRWRRGRVGTYVPVDYLLLLMLYAASNERSLAAFFRHARHFGAALAGVWFRFRLPSASALSRFLASVDKPLCECLRSLFCLTSSSMAWPTSAG